MSLKSESEHILNRERLTAFLKSEIMGPCTEGEELECSGPIFFEKWEDAMKPWIQKNSHDEIIKRETPVNRYGIGVLYPPQVAHPEIQSSDVSKDQEVPEQGEPSDSFDMKPIGKPENVVSDSDDFDLSLTNTLQPSSMGISFLAELPEGSEIIVDVNAGRYQPRQVEIGGITRTWFFREAVSLPGISFSSSEVRKGGAVKNIEKSYDNGLKLSVECFSRPDCYSNDEKPNHRRLVTVCLVNRTSRKASTASMQSELTLFQSSFSVHVQGGRILPYPEGEMVSDLNNDSERASFRLLYSRKQTFAVGHGCAACWNDSSDAYPEYIKADPLPEYEIPSITPDALTSDGQLLKISMAVLADYEEGRYDLLKMFIAEYRSWITAKVKDIPSIAAGLQKTARIHIDRAAICADRMEAGLAFLMNDKLAERAFILSNRAILLQQVAGNRKRDFEYDIKNKRNLFNPPYKNISLKKLPKQMGFWRAFQIAFILMSLRSSVTHCDERDEVELIWFPTGGGKTEAYLGLAAFAMFYRRLKDPDDDGVHVLMRYTLRLLTTQQFQRASRLICAMEKIRQEEGGMGDRPFSIGIWVGSANTPNKKDGAKTAKKLQTNRYAENPFVIRQCPWCGAEMGQKIIKNKPYVPGYIAKGGTVIFKCPDKQCLFHKNLPIHVIDEEIYEIRPSLIIGTVDKFAMLSWVPASSSIFGIDSNGERTGKPPGLIIQDELHLISGPLGTMVGLYETIIEDLCTDRENGKGFKPKIVCSTATIRRYQEQVRSLFAREKTNLFPPSGLDAGDSFFARYAVDDDGKLLPGRRYMGIYAPGLPSMQTLQVRVYSALLMGSILFDGIEKRDPWWTLLIFFNSIRELGGALSLFQTDIPGALKGIAARRGFKERRFLNRVLELTSRMTNEEVPNALEELAKEYSGKNVRSIDVCLASSIIEVGIDVDRLALMSIVGQPKTIAQYIQVSGRVGRKWWERPGLVTTLFSSSKPRDRSHFEKFQSAHSQMYAQVEPTSVTPFAPPVIDRALHALFAVYLRLMGSSSAADSPLDVDPSLIEQLKRIIEKRVKFIDENEYDSVMKKFDKRLKQFNRWERQWWDKQQEQSDCLLRRYETWVTEDMKKTSWATPTSMRNVDAECQMDITTMYVSDEDEEGKEE